MVERHHLRARRLPDARSSASESIAFASAAIKLPRGQPLCFITTLGPFSVSTSALAGEGSTRGRRFARTDLKPDLSRWSTFDGRFSVVCSRAPTCRRALTPRGWFARPKQGTGLIRCCEDAAQGAVELRTTEESSTGSRSATQQPAEESHLTRGRSPSQLALARMALVGTTIVWAANNILVKKLYALGLQPGLVTAARFSLSALVLSPFATWRALGPALSLSLTSFAGNASLALSLRFTTAGRASFFAAMSVAVTPFLEFLLYGKPLRPAFLIASVLCVTGVFFMSRESLMAVRMEHLNAISMGNRTGPHLWAMLRGDVLALLAAFWFALYTVRLSREAPKHRAEALSSSLRVWTACLATIWASIESWMTGRVAPVAETVAPSPPTMLHGLSTTFQQMLSSLVTRLNRGGVAAYAGLGLLAVLVIVGAYCQVYGQQRVSSEEAAVLYTLNPIWAGIAGYLFLAETFTLEQAFGGVCILLGCIYARKQQQRRVSNK